MGEFDVPVVLGDEFFGKVRYAHAGFNGGGDVVAEGSDEAKNGSKSLGTD